MGAVENEGGALDGHRKFIMALLGMILSFILAVWVVPPADVAVFWPWVLGLELGLFGGANVFEHLAKRGR